jgi:hypothetical protein
MAYELASPTSTSIRRKVRTTGGQRIMNITDKKLFRGDHGEGFTNI